MRTLYPSSGNREVCDVLNALRRYEVLWWQLTPQGRKAMERQLAAANDECDSYKRAAKSRS